MNSAPAPPPLHSATSAPSTWMVGAPAAELLHAADHPLQELHGRAAVAERHDAAVGGDRVLARRARSLPLITKSPPSPSPQKPNASNWRMISNENGS